MLVLTVVMIRRKFHLTAVAAIVMMAFITVVIPATVSAYTCNGVETSIDFKCDGSTDSITAILLYVLNFLAAGVGIAVVIGIVWGGLRYSGSDGNASEAQEGMAAIRNAVIGLILFIFMWAAANFFIPGGAFRTNAFVNNVQPTQTTSSTTGLPGNTNNSASSLPDLSDKIFNFRDAAASGVLKPGILFRSARLTDATTGNKSSTDASMLSVLLKDGIIIDLREKKEVSKAPDAKIPGVSTKNIPATGTGDYTIFVNDASDRKAFGSAITAIANTKGSVLVHCTYGKDRTGWTIAMVMYALGATDKQVMDQYKLSNANLPPGGNKVTEKMLNAGLDKARAKYGSIDKYLKDGLGLTTATLDALKKKLKA